MVDTINLKFLLNLLEEVYERSGDMPVFISEQITKNKSVYIDGEYYVKFPFGNCIEKTTFDINGVETGKCLIIV